MEFTFLRKFYRNHIEEDLLPFWIRALDHQNGGIFTCFNNRGDQLISKDKYTWSQGRFIWIWSKVVKLILKNRLYGKTEFYLEHLDKTISFLERNVFMENGNCAFLLSETGEKKESTTDSGFDTSIFADCFVVMGLAAYSGLKQDSVRFEKALKMYENIVDRLERGAFRSDPYPIPKGYRAHSISMIMLNILQELTETSEILNHPENDALKRKCVTYMNDIMTNYYQPDHSVSELYSECNSENTTLLSRHINPGHTIESMWFIIKTAKRAEFPDFIDKATLAMERAIDIGWDMKYGGLFRFVDLNGGKPTGIKQSSPFEQLITDTWDLKLWWPHSEALYGTMLAFKETGNKKMINYFKKIHDYVFKTFPNSDKNIGEWIQIQNREGKPIDKVAALPVKDPFHILRNMMLLTEILEEDKKLNYLSESI